MSCRTTCEAVMSCDAQSSSKAFFLSASMRTVRRAGLSSMRSFCFPDMIILCTYHVIRMVVLSPGAGCEKPTEHASARGSSFCSPGLTLRQWNTPRRVPAAGRVEAERRGEGSGRGCGARHHGSAHPRLADGQVDECGARGAHDVHVPEPVVRAGPLE